jgi:hypothetical protein
MIVESDNDDPLPVRIACLFTIYNDLGALDTVAISLWID